VSQQLSVNCKIRLYSAGDHIRIAWLLQDAMDGFFAGITTPEVYLKSAQRSFLQLENQRN